MFTINHNPKVKKNVPVFIILTLIIIVLLLMVPRNYSDESDTPYFPVLRGEVGMEALATGTLILKNGYLRLSRSDSVNTYLVIWPKGYSMDTEGDEIQILDEDEQIVATVGDTISVGGGVMGWLNVLWVKGGFLPFNCNGPYWVSNEVTAN